MFGLFELLLGLFIVFLTLLTAYSASREGDRYQKAFAMMICPVALAVAGALIYFGFGRLF